MYIHTRSVNIVTLALPGDFLLQESQGMGGGGLLGPLQNFLFDLAEILLQQLLDHYRYKTWFKKRNSSTVGNQSHGGQMITKRSLKRAIFKVLKLREKWTQMMSNCLVKCEKVERNE